MSLQPQHDDAWLDQWEQGEPEPDLSGRTPVAELERLAYGAPSDQVRVAALRILVERHGTLHSCPLCTELQGMTIEQLNAALDIYAAPPIVIEPAKILIPDAAENDTARVIVDQPPESSADAEGPAAPDEDPPLPQDPAEPEALPLEDVPVFADDVAAMRRRAWLREHGVDEFAP